VKPYKAKETKRQRANANFYSHIVPPAEPEETEFRHACWQNHRDRIRRHLVNAGSNVFQLNRWDECGSECLVEWSDTADKYRLRANYCKNRHCAPCAKARAGLLAANLRNRLAEQPQNNDRYRFICLTLKHSSEPLANQIKRLYKCFTKLRKSPCWKKSQRGGTAVLEVKWTPGSRVWHPHLHIVSEGDFLRSKDLKDAWFKATGDSFVTDIRKLDSGKDAAHYVTKYISKGTSDAVWLDDAAAVEWITALKGTRLATTYGTWRGFQLMHHDPRNDVTDWKPVGLLRNIARQAWAGSYLDQLLMLRLEEALQFDPHKQRKKREPPHICIQ